MNFLGKKKLYVIILLLKLHVTTLGRYIRCLSFHKYLRIFSETIDTQPFQAIKTRFKYLLHSAHHIILKKIYK